MAVSLIFLMASKIFYGKYAKIPQSLCPDRSDYGQPALFLFMCFCLFSVTRKKKKKKKLFSHGGESSSEPAVHWPWLNLSSLAMSPCHFTSHPSFFSAINYGAKIEWENACQIPSTGLKHWMLWTPGSAWNTAFAKSLLTDLRDIVNHVSHSSPSITPNLVFGLDSDEA